MRDRPSGTLHVPSPDIKWVRCKRFPSQRAFPYCHYRKCGENSLQRISIQVNQPRAEAASNLPSAAPWGGLPLPEAGHILQAILGPRVGTPPISSRSRKLYRMFVRSLENLNLLQHMGVYINHAQVSVFITTNHSDTLHGRPTHTDILCRRPKSSRNARQSYQYLNLWILILKMYPSMQQLPSSW